VTRFSGGRFLAPAADEDRLDDPFNGLFTGRGARSIPDGGLLDFPAAHQWLELVEWGSTRDLYTYQAALEGRSGPRVVVHGRSMLLLSSYDYLGLIGNASIEAASTDALRRYGSGTGGVRLLTGTTELHRELEARLAGFKGTEAALTFTSGYLATMGLVAALFGPGDRVVMDSLAHRSIVDACRLAGVPFRRFRHNDPDSLDRELRREPIPRRTLIIVEGVYSMDGDVCVLRDVVELKKRHGAFLMVDEAHSFGALGATGRGIDEHWGLPACEVDVWVGSLSKAIPANGGFLAGSRELVAYLQHGAAPFMFSSALCPAAAAAALAALRVLQAEPWRLVAAHRNAARLRDGLRALGEDTGGSSTCIVPVLLGGRETAFSVARVLFARGVLASAVVPPAVPQDAARLRLCATAAHSDEDLAEALAAFAQVRG
jgi:8-amino-7-oxononanoate synthase